MHILTVSLDYPPNVGGIAAHVYELCQALSDIGHEVSLLTKNYDTYPDAEQIVEGIRIVPMPPRRFGPTYGMTINRQIAKAVERLQPDLIHIHGMRPLEFLKPKIVPCRNGQIAANKIGIAWVKEFYNDMPESAYYRHLNVIASRNCFTIMPHTIASNCHREL